MEDSESEFEVDSDESEHESLPDEMRNDFDIESTKAHSYIFQQDTVEVVNIDVLSENESHVLPFFEPNTVVVPGETLPLTPRCPFTISSLQRLVNENQFVVLIANFRQQYDPHNWREVDVPCVAVIAKITKHSGLDGRCGVTRVSVEFSAIHRCKVFSIDRNSRKCGVTILPDVEMPSVMSLTLSRSELARSPKNKARLCSSIINYPLFATYDMSLRNCETLIQYLSNWFSENSLRNILAMGKVLFSFWVTANFTMEVSKKYELLCEDSTDLRLLHLVKNVKRMNRSVCLTCGGSIFKTADIIKMSSEGVGGHYVNPGGVVHNLVTVSDCQSFIYQGPPSSEFCWFPGYRWQIIICSRCYSHLGWEYTSDTLKPRKFYGITRSSVEQVIDKTVDDEDEP